MKIKSIIIVLTICLCLVLTGCVGMVLDTTINSDGAGTVTIKGGFSEMAMQMMNSLGEGEGNQIEVNGESQEAIPFTHKGKIYHGTVQTKNFNNVNEFNTIMSEAKEDEEIDSGIFELIKNSDGSFTLNLQVTVETANTEETEISMQAMDIPEEQIALLMKDIVMEYTFLS